MTNAQYATFVKYLMEGDNPFSLAPGTVGDVISDQLKKLIDAAHTGGAKAISCMTALYKQYGVASWQRLCEFVKALFAQGKGYMGKIYAKIGPAITSAINWVKSNAGPMAAKAVNVVKSGLSSLKSSVALHSWWYLGLAAAAISAVLFKVAMSFEKASKAAEKKFSAVENNTAAYRAYLNKSVDKAVMESKAMFSDLTQFTESVRMSEGPLDAIKGGVDKISGGFSKLANSFVDKMQPKVMEMWSKVSTIAKSNKVLAIAITVCTACVFSFIGVRKYLASRKLEKTIEAVVAKKAKKGSSAGKKLAAKPKAAKPVKAKSNIKTAVKKMASKKK